MSLPSNKKLLRSIAFALLFGVTTGVGLGTIRHLLIDRASSSAPQSTAQAAASLAGTCERFLDFVAHVSYDRAGVEKLINTKHQCPSGPDVTLDQAISYVNGVLQNAFGNDLTKILSPDEANRLTTWLSGRGQAFAGGGIGVELSIDPSQRLWAEPVTRKHRYKFTGLIYHVIPNSPADKAGLQDGDVITGVEGHYFKDLGPNDPRLDAEFVTNTWLRGESGSAVTITVKRRDGTEVNHKLIREVVIPEHVWSRNLEYLDQSGSGVYKGIYSIVVSDFVPQTAARIYAEVSKLGPQARGFVLDLRDAPGGDFDKSIIAVAPLLHQGKIVSTEQRIFNLDDDPSDIKLLRTTYTRVGPHVVKEVVDMRTGRVLSSDNLQVTQWQFDQAQNEYRWNKSEDFPFIGGKPMAVLFNGGTKSAAETFMLALVDNRISSTDENVAQGAIAIGDEPSGGKGSGQTYYKGPLGTLIRSTTFHWFGPKGEWLGNGRDIRHGMSPSIKIAQPDNAVPYTPTDHQLLGGIEFIRNGGQQ